MSDALHTSKRVIIVGGGISGLSIAVRLAQAGLPVTVLEASQIGAEASTRNQGWLHSGGWFASLQPELARMCLESMQHTRRFCPECQEPQHDSMIYAMHRSDAVELWTEGWETAGIPYEQVPREILSERLPMLASSEIESAFQLPDLAIRFEVLLQRLASEAEDAGAEIRTETPVADLLRVGRRVQGVVTASGEEIVARLVILAGNALGINLYPTPGESDVADQVDHGLVALKSHLVAVEPGVGHWPLCVVDVDGFNHIPHSPTSVFGTSRWLPVSDARDEQVSSEEIELIWQNIRRFFPQRSRDQCKTVEWAGTTLQVIQAGMVEPAITPLPAIIEHSEDSPATHNLLSVFPGRATLWAHLAEQTRAAVLDKLERRPATPTTPPWGRLTTPSDQAITRAAGELRSVALYHCQHCGKVAHRQLGLRRPICCGEEMAWAAEQTGQSHQ